jgi:hypothetical protein
MRVIRTLVFPWFLFFVASVAGYVTIGAKFPQVNERLQSAFPVILLAGTAACVLTNIRSMGNLGIWLSESLPDSLRYGSGRWIYRALLAAVIASIFWGLSKLPWTPLIWQAAILPFVVTISLFVIVSNLLGPALKISSNMAWSRFFAVLLSWPIVALVPFSSMFVGRMILSAYQASHADLTVQAAETATAPELVQLTGRVLSIVGDQMRVFAVWPTDSDKNKTLDVQLDKLPLSQLNALPKGPTDKAVTMAIDTLAIKETDVKGEPGKLDEKDIRSRLKSTKPAVRASAFREIYEFSSNCSEYSKDITVALDQTGPAPVVLWATHAVLCSDIKAVVALPRLADILVHHADPSVRAASVRAMKKYGHENLKQIAYLLIKRLNPEEDAQVVSAVASALAPLDADHARWTTNRLKLLLDTEKLSGSSAQVLAKDLGRADLVSEYVAVNLAGNEAARNRAVRMICLLPKKDRTVAQPHLANILASIKSADQKDPGLKALDCMGQPGFEALKAELMHPQKLEKSVSARAFAQLDVDEFPDAMETANSCARDKNEQVSRWCSQSLGRIGAPALPAILDMLKSSDSGVKEAGRNALRYFDDPRAKKDLEKVVRENSGWMANNKNLQVAKAVANALVKIEGKAVTSSSSTVE